MISSLTKAIEGNFSLGYACQLVSEHEDYFTNGVGLKLDLRRAAYVDPSIVSLIVQFNKKHSGLLELINPQDSIKSMIEKTTGIRNPGTILPALAIADYLPGDTIERIKFWLRVTLGRHYSNNKNASSSPIALTAIELINNVIDHAQSDLGGTISGANFSSRKHIELTVIDLGSTIPGTLSPLYPGLPDHELIAKALEFGVSRRKGQAHNYGRGLDIVKNYALQDANCSLVIISRNGFASITNAELPHCRLGRYCFNGTIVKCNFSEKFITQTLEHDEPDGDLEF